MVDSVAMSGWGSLDPQNLHKNSKQIKFMLLMSIAFGAGLYGIELLGYSKKDAAT
jgi:hypothetical protein